MPWPTIFHAAASHEPKRPEVAALYTEISRGPWALLVKGDAQAVDAGLE